MEKESWLEQQGYSYQYLRSQWVHFRALNDRVELEDRLDRLNKTVAAIRSRTLNKLGDVRADHRFRSEELRAQDENGEVAQRLDRVGMQK